MRFGPFSYHLARGELRRGEEVVRLSEREREILRLLSATNGETLPREALAETANAANERTIDVQSTACAGRSRMIRAIPCIFKRCVALATAW